MSPPRLLSSSGRANAATLIVTVLVLLIGAEIVLRAIYHPQIVGSIIRYDPVLGWSLRPKASQVIDVSERGFHPRVDVNSLGLREREVSVDRPAKRRRVLIVGDSVVFGSGLATGERFSDRLGEALTGRVEVINAGVPGWGNDQELLFYETSLRRLKPDLVILTFTANNDVVNNALAGAMLEGGTKPRFTLAGDSLVLAPPAPPARLSAAVRAKHVLRKSRLLVFVRRRLQRLSYRHQVQDNTAHEFHGFEAYRHLSHWSVYDTHGGEAIESAWRVTEAILGRFAADCRADSAGFCVFAMPMRLDVDDAWRERLMEHTGMDPARIDMELPYRRLSACCAANGIPFYFPLEEFRAAARSEPLYFDVDGHPNSRGNALAAEYLGRLAVLAAGGAG